MAKLLPCYWVLSAANLNPLLTKKSPQGLLHGNDLPPWLTRQCVSCFEVSSFFSSTIFWHSQYWILLSSTVQIRHQSCLFCCQFLLLVSLGYPHVSTASWDWLTPFLHVNQLRNPPIKQNNGEVLPDLMKPDNYGDQRQMPQYIPENSIT